MLPITICVEAIYRCNSKCYSESPNHIQYTHAIHQVEDNYNVVIYMYPAWLYIVSTWNYTTLNIIYFFRLKSKSIICIPQWIYYTCEFIRDTDNLTIVRNCIHHLLFLEHIRQVQVLWCRSWNGPYPELKASRQSYIIFTYYLILHIIEDWFPDIYVKCLTEDDRFVKLFLFSRYDYEEGLTNKHK